MDYDLQLLWQQGSTPAETTWARKLLDFVTRHGADQDGYGRDEQRLHDHYKAKLDAAEREGKALRRKAAQVRSKDHTSPALEEFDALGLDVEEDWIP